MTTTFQHSTTSTQVTWEVITDNNVTLTHRDTCRKVACLAQHLIKNAVCQNLSDAMKMAWVMVKAQPELTYVTFKTVKGEIKHRVVMTNWSTMIKIKGTGRPSKPGQVLFADVAKYIADIPCIISTYEIIEQF